MSYYFEFHRKESDIVMTVWSSTDQEVGGFVNDNPFMAQMILTFSTNNNGVLKSAFDQEMRDLHADFRSKTDKCALEVRKGRKFDANRTEEKLLHEGVMAKLKLQLVRSEHHVMS